MDRERELEESVDTASEEYQHGYNDAIDGYEMREHGASEEYIEGFSDGRSDVDILDSAEWSPEIRGTWFSQLRYRLRRRWILLDKNDDMVSKHWLHAMAEAGRSLAEENDLNWDEDKRLSPFRVERLP